MKILFKYPTRSRPKIFKNTLKTWIEKLSNNHSYNFLINFDEDDVSMNTSSMKKWIESQENCNYIIGKCKNKVEAINYGVPDENWDILILVSDDMLPVVERYDDIICKLFDKYFPDTDGVIHVNDGRRGKDLNCLVIEGYKYYKRFDYIYCGDFLSLWCDNEFMDVSRRLKKVIYYDKVIIKHFWPGSKSDQLMKRNESFYSKDRVTYLRRKAKGFPRRSIF